MICALGAIARFVAHRGLRVPWESAVRIRFYCGRVDQKITRLKRLSLHNATLNRLIFKTFRSDWET